jgi:ribosomal protein L14E/L6E/L27E
MPDYTGWIVRAEAGRDKGGLFCVMGIVSEQRRLLLADGKRRKAARPKAKGFNHVKLLTGGFDHPAIQKLKQGEALSDKALRRALAAFRDQLEV